MDLLRHWVVEHEDSGARPVAVRDEVHADDYRGRPGYKVTGPYVLEAQQPEGAVSLLREIGAMAGAKANGADARAMAKRAREFVASLDHPGGQ